MAGGVTRRGAKLQNNFPWGRKKRKVDKEKRPEPRLPGKKKEGGQG